MERGFTMMEWLRLYGGSLILGGALLALVLRIIYRLIQNHKEGRSTCCGGGCKQCSMGGACHCHSESHSHGEKQVTKPSHGRAGACCCHTGAGSEKVDATSQLARLSGRPAGDGEASGDLQPRIERVLEEYEAHKAKQTKVSPR